MTASKVADGTELDRDMRCEQIRPHWLAADYHRSARMTPSEDGSQEVRLNTGNSMTPGVRAD